MNDGKCPVSCKQNDEDKDSKPKFFNRLLNDRFMLSIHRPFPLTVTVACVGGVSAHRWCSHRGQIRVRTEFNRPQPGQGTVTESALASDMISRSSIASIACRPSLRPARIATPSSKGNRPRRSRISHPLAAGKNDRVARNAAHAIINNLNWPTDDIETPQKIVLSVLLQSESDRHYTGQRTVNQRPASAVFAPGLCLTS